MMLKDKVEEILKAKGMTKGELAEKMGVSPQSLSRTLKNSSKKSISRISEVLEIDEQVLMAEREVICDDTTAPVNSSMFIRAPRSENNSLNGYVECRGKVFKISSKEDLYQVIAYYDGYILNKEDDKTE